jgi:hypothetical protein
MADGELEEDELHPPPTRYYQREIQPRHHSRDDDEGDRN